MEAIQANVLPNSNRHIALPLYKSLLPKILFFDYPMCSYFVVHFFTRCLSTAFISRHSRNEMLVIRLGPRGWCWSLHEEKHTEYTMDLKGLGGLTVNMGPQLHPDTVHSDTNRALDVVPFILSRTKGGGKRVMRYGPWNSIADAVH